ncbi:tRNA guanosine(15) transglycosylase TgtA [Candidatus Bathyarchaeota archaeon]|nr:MAG: tRNA guanosine(15) transglycosylase TgtA [Candidatus Bathyarchaeota archaeon]
MCFEVKDRDLLARVGLVETKSGRFETPALLPVVNPAIQPVSPRELGQVFGFEAIITNAYIIMRHFGEKAVEEGIHEALGFDGVVATDSGAYQLLVYGKVDVGPGEVVAYQEAIGSDIATILDVPTGWTDSREEALRTVMETARRGEELWSLREREDVLWIGPVQGGCFTDLVALSARLMSSMPFHIHALGSPTPVMENYRFDLLVDMIMAAKLNLPPDRPFHLFGAGHPMTFALAVALGCDTFDSAAYAIYARDGRYMMEDGTARLEELSYLPCSCPVCVRRDPEDLLEMPEADRIRLLAMHNLYVCLKEIRAIRQAIREGRLWEHLAERAHAHPSLLKAFRRLAEEYHDVLEASSPTRRKKGIFIFSSPDLYRPEVVRYRRRLVERFRPGGRILLLLPYPEQKPFSRSQEHERLLGILHSRLGDRIWELSLCLYCLPFGLIPVELDQVHPLSQYEFSGQEEGVLGWALETASRFLSSRRFDAVVLLSDGSELSSSLEEAIGKLCRRGGSMFLVLREENPWSENSLSRLAEEVDGLLRPS